MPYLIGALLGGLLELAASLAGRVLLALGLGFATYSGFNAALDWLLDEAKVRIGAGPLWAVQIAGLLKIDVCISLIASAFAVRLLVAGIQSGAVRKLVSK
jgi:hypothetical protein